jgi:hypothetical protein
VCKSRESNAAVPAVRALGRLFLVVSGQSATRGLDLHDLVRPGGITLPAFVGDTDVLDHFARLI